MIKRIIKILSPFILLLYFIILRIQKIINPIKSYLGKNIGEVILIIISIISFLPLILFGIGIINNMPNISILFTLILVIYIPLFLLDENENERGRNDNEENRLMSKYLDGGFEEYLQNSGVEISEKEQKTINEKKKLIRDNLKKDKKLKNKYSL